MTAPMPKPDLNIVDWGGHMVSAYSVKFVHQAFTRSDLRDRERCAEAVAQVATLPPREREVLILLSKGCNSPAIAGLLGLSVHTVRQYVGQMQKRLGINSVAEAAVIAAFAGLA